MKKVQIILSINNEFIFINKIIPSFHFLHTSWFEGSLAFLLLCYIVAMWSFHRVDLSAFQGWRNLFCYCLTTSGKQTDLGVDQSVSFEIFSKYLSQLQGPLIQFHPIYIWSTGPDRAGPKRKTQEQASNAENNGEAHSAFLIRSHKASLCLLGTGSTISAPQQCLTVKTPWECNYGRRINANLDGGFCPKMDSTVLLETSCYDCDEFYIFRKRVACN